MISRLNWNFMIIGSSILQFTGEYRRGAQLKPDHRSTVEERVRAERLQTRASPSRRKSESHKTEFTGLPNLAITSWEWCVLYQGKGKFECWMPARIT